MSELDNLIDRVSRGTSWYSSLQDGYDNINELIKIKRLLLGYSFRISKYVGDAKKDYKEAYANRKKEYATERLRLIESGTTGVKAELLTEGNKWDLRVIEARSEGLYVKLKGFQVSLNGVINSITQDLSILRKEFEESKNNQS